MANVDLVLPVYNEEQILATSVARVLEWIGEHPEHEWRIVVADNASTDRTYSIARELEAEHGGKEGGRFVALHIPVKGRGIALRVSWLTSPADVLAYMDVDLSTDMKHLPELIDPIAAGQVDIAYGTRLHRDSETERSFRRELTSRTYVQILRRLGSAQRQRRAVRVQGDRARARTGAAPAGARHRLVLRLGTAAAGAGERLSPARGARALDRGSRQPRRDPPHGA